jgi:hypothetical protein
MPEFNGMTRATIRPKTPKKGISMDLAVRDSPSKAPKPPPRVQNTTRSGRVSKPTKKAAETRAETGRGSEQAKDEA